MRNFFISRVLLIFVCYTIKPTKGIVHLKSLSTSFSETPARFSAGFNSSGICGALHVADPLDACSSLLNNGFQFDDPAALKFALIVRGNCTFQDKIRNAQEGGFHAAIVYDDQDQRNLISTGETLKKHAQGEDSECCIITSLGETAWNVLIISFISLLVIASVPATFFFTHIYWRNQRRSSNLGGGKLVELLPCLTFSAAQISGYMGDTCAICLESYHDGENLKVLPCQHKFHANCVGSWLTKWNTLCPVCKYDLKTELHILR